MNRLDTIKNALLSVTQNVFHFTAGANAVPPYVVWAEDSADSFEANNVHAESVDEGTIDLYTLDENEPLREAIPQALNACECAWYKNSTQYEEDTGLIHDEWVFQV